MKKFFSVLFLSVAAVGFIACDEKQTLDSSACFSLDFNRYQLGEFIIDTPPGVSADTQFDRDRTGKNSRRNAFVRASSLKDFIESYKKRTASGKETVLECQLKAYVPYPAGNELNLFYNQSPKPKEKWLRRSELELIQIALPGVFEKYPATSYKRNLANNLFHVDEVEKIRVISDDPAPKGKPVPMSFETVFEIEGRVQSVGCNTALCSDLVFQDDDGLIYSVMPDKYSWKENRRSTDSDDPDNFDIIAAEDLPETVIPVLNFARSLRNREAEKDLK